MNELPDQHIGSFVFTLRAKQSQQAATYLGRAIQQCFLMLVGQVDPNLADQLHEGTNGIRPYTVSGLFRSESLQPVHGSITTDEQVWFRVTALNDVVCEAVHRLAATQSDRTLELDRVDWMLERITEHNGGWALQSSYQMLMAQHMALHPRAELRLTFDSPTGFHSKGSTVPFPMPALLFESLIARWKAFSPIALPELLPNFVEQHVMIHTFNGAARSILHKGGHTETGFVGQMTYRIVQENVSLHKLKPELSHKLQNQHSTLARMVNLLTDYALFSGAGFKTASGMGMLHRTR